MADRLELSKAHQRMLVAMENPSLIDEIAYRVSEGETINEVCDAMRLPYGLMAKWIAEDDERSAKYEMALRLKADAHAHEALQIADNVAADPAEIAKAKLQVDTRLKLAGKWDKKRYGNDNEGVPTGFAGGINIVIAGVESPYVIEGESKKVADGG